MKSILLLTVFIIFAFRSNSQTHRFKHINSLDGISQSEVFTIYKDKLGYMWFGTVDGLNKYDGYSITIFNTNKKSPFSLSNNTIMSLAEDRFNRMWIGTDDGLCVYNQLDEKIYKVVIDSTLKVNLSIKVILYFEDFLFVGTSNGLYYTKLKQNQAISEIYFNKIEKFTNRNNTFVVSDLKICKNGGIWVTTFNSLSRIIFDLQNKPVIIEDPEFNYPYSIKSVTEDYTGNLWLSTISDGLLRYNTGSGQFYQFTNNQSTTSISSNWLSNSVLDENGNLWIGTINNGINWISKNDLKSDNIVFNRIESDPLKENSLATNLIYTLYYSPDNLLWAGTLGKGVNVYDPQQKQFEHIRIPEFNNFGPPATNFIRAVYKDEFNNVWIGTHNNGLFIYNQDTKKFIKSGFENHAIFFITKFANNRFLVCGNNGIWLVSHTQNNLKVHDHFYISAAFNVKSFKNNILWAATINGLLKFTITNDKMYKLEMYDTGSTPALSKNNCRVICCNPENNELWVGTEGGGLNIIKLDSTQKPVSNTIYKSNPDSFSLSNNYIRTIIRDKNNDFWVGTYEGLNKAIYSDNPQTLKFKVYLKTDGLPNNMIQLIEEDNIGNLWIGTNGGLTCFNPVKNTYQNYTVSDGLQSNEFSEHTSFKAQNGEILVGGINGINTFFPEKIKESNIVPNLKITDFYLFNNKIEVLRKYNNRIVLNKTITLTDSIKLLPYQNDFRFEFSALIFSDPSKVAYKYKLEGYDKEWNLTDSKHRSANYTNLKHGKYTFKVMATNPDGIWDNQVRSIYIHIKTPFAYTWVAYFIYIAIITLLFIYFANFSVIRIATKKRIIMENEHNRKLNDLNELRTRFFINISHDLRTPLTLIAGPINNILKSKTLDSKNKDQLDLVNRNVLKLKHLIEQLLDFRKAETKEIMQNLKINDIVEFIRSEICHFEIALKNKGLYLNIYPEVPKMQVAFDEEIISKIIFNVISNSLKYTSQGGIGISISKISRNQIQQFAPSFGEYIKISIQDTGTGISEEELSKIFDRFYHDRSASGGYGIGLSHCRELITAHDGFIFAESTLKEGTTIHFCFPYRSIEENKVSVEITKGNDVTNGKEAFSDNPKIEPKTILIIEDNADMLEYLLNGFEKNYRIETANDGIAGLKKVKELMPDLIISDIMIPNLSGLDLCKKIKSDINTCHIPVILLTARADDETKYLGYEFGADDYIIKPFQMELLMIRIQNILKSREQLRQTFLNDQLLEPSTLSFSSIDQKFMKDLLSAIEKGIPDENFSVNSLELELGMSHSNFYRKVKNLTGLSGKEILDNMRMKRAFQLLKDDKNIRVSDVAYMVGFSNPKYFSKCFKEKFNSLPSDVLNQILKIDNRHPSD